MRPLFLSLIFIFITTTSLFAQSESIIIDKLTISGNKHTNDAVIIRELPFSLGDTILLTDWTHKINQTEKQLMNTGLFTEVSIYYLNWEGSSQKVHLAIDLAETWYIYPVPTFSLADRNFNVWWKEQNRSLERINIGLDLSHTNLTGWKDEGKIGFVYGYTRSFDFSYSHPYLNKDRTLGLSVNFDYDKNREINYQTEANKLLFYNNPDKFIRRQLKAEAGLSWRPKLYGEHHLRVGYLNNWVDTIITKQYNPDYFEKGNNHQRFFRLFYSFNFDFRDNRGYPWEGYNIGGHIEKDGWGIFDERNSLTCNINASTYLPLGQYANISIGTRVKYSFIRSPQALIYNRGIGFGHNKMSGYELYVIDGLDAFIIKTNLRHQLWNNDITFGRWVFLEAFRKLPFQLNASLTNDWGYVNSPHNTGNNTLNNRLLWGGGIGFDFVFYYDFVLRCQYSFNQFKEGGIFLDLAIGI